MLAWQLGRTDGDLYVNHIKKAELSGRGAIVSRRQPDGTWRIVLDNPLIQR